MQTEAGFSLTEVLVALIVLSLAAIALSQSTSSMIQVWDRTRSSIETIDTLANLSDEALPWEQVLRKPLGILEGPGLEIDDGPPLLLATARLDRDATCVFDMVGRRCR